VANGRPWLPEHTETMERMRDRPASEIAKATGHALRTVRYHLQSAGLTTQGSRAHWSRRDWLLADASGLDFQMHSCRS
jgi:hypothetical protein